MKINDLDKQLRPREKALTLGVDKLSDIELLALFLRSGTVKRSCIEIATDLLHHHSLGQLNRMSFNELLNYEGISSIKAIELKAVFELARRCVCQQVYHANLYNEPSLIVEYMRMNFNGSDREAFVCFFMDNACHLLHVETVSVGTINATVAYPREIAKLALAHHSNIVIVAHNHPSGNCNPSNADIQLTHLLKNALELLGIQCVDHIIVSNQCYYSFSENGQL